uniref:Uncharacterized protein n=1 Tax=Anguilla anguilla TaxID=7936 RepID=A0A0E9TKG2_ANGAN
MRTAAFPCQDLVRAPTIALVSTEWDSRSYEFITKSLAFQLSGCKAGQV